MHFITIICGSLRIMTELSFWGCENLASNDTLGLPVEVDVPFIALYSIFALSSQIFLDLSVIYLTFHFHVDTYFIVNPIIRTCLTENPLNSLIIKSLFCHSFLVFVRKQSMMPQTILALSVISFIICYNIFCIPRNFQVQVKPVPHCVCAVASWPSMHTFYPINYLSYNPVSLLPCPVFTTLYYVLFISRSICVFSKWY